MAWPKGKPRKPRIPTVFIPDSVIPKRVSWDGYERIRPWVALYAYREHGCILSRCTIRWDAVERGHWVKGPQKEVQVAITRQEGALLCACGNEAAVWWLISRDGQRELEACPTGWAEFAQGWRCPEHLEPDAVVADLDTEAPGDVTHALSD